jgi:hypothetical protein
MTTIAYRNGILAADSRVTVSSEAGGDRTFQCEKLFRKMIPGPDGTVEEVIFATAGDSTSGMVFVDWYGSGHEAPVTQWCRGMQIKDEFYAIGSGCKLALGAMEMGAGALKAVEIAGRRDPYTAGPFTTMRLKNVKAKPAVPKVRKADDPRRSDSSGKAPLGL